MALSGTRSFAWRLYVILDPAAAGGRDLRELATAALRGGADVLQLRDKRGSVREILREAARILPLARGAGIPLLLNDRPDLAAAAGADGVHLGQDDLPVADARRLLGPAAIIGTSTHSLEQAQAALEEPVDYIALGPIFATPTKPNYGHVGLDLIRPVVAQARCPVVCIGGIELATLDHVLEAGASCVAVVRAVCAAADPEAAARRLKSRLTHVQAADLNRTPGSGTIAA